MYSKMVKPDAKGRVTLGHLADGVSRFLIKLGKDHTIILEPYTEIPAREKWLFENDHALDKVKRGLAESATGKTSEIGSFSKHLDKNTK